MRKKMLLVLLPFVLLFLLGFGLLIRPHFQVQIAQVTKRFTKQEKTSMRSSHRREAHYAEVLVAADGRQQAVTVRDNAWIPLEAGHRVVVARSLAGKLVEYTTDEAYSLIACSAVMGPAVCGLFALIARRKKASPAQR